MRAFKQAPFLKICIPFILGMTVAQVIEPNKLPGTFIICLVLGVLIWVAIPKNTSFSNRFIFSICFAPLLFGLGGLRTSFSHFGIQDPHAAISPNKSERLFRLEENPQPNSQQVICRLLHSRFNGPWKPNHNKVQVYFKNKDSLLRCTAGDCILAECYINKIEGPKNPGAFDYREFMRRKGVAHKAYVDRFKQTPVTHSSFRIRLILWRDILVKRFENAGVTGDNLSIVAALAFGEKGLLSKETKNDYSAAGVVHLLAVSGLHVGLIYLIIVRLSAFLLRTGRLKLLTLPFTLMALWMYASMTGLSPSVCRAATMFSFIAFGQQLDRQPNLFNSLAASAVLLLVINPDLLTDVGFQLSYLAVLGIGIFYRPLNKLLWFKRRIPKIAWDMTCVSSAAQLATTPLSLYYFNQFPNGFLITNLMAIPLATAILYTSLLFTGLSWLPGISKILAFILNKLCYTLNWCIHQVAEVPISVTRNLFLDQMDVILLYFGIILIARFVFSKKRVVLLVMMIALTLTLGVRVWTKQFEAVHHETIIHALNKETLISENDGHQIMIYGTSDSQKHLNQTLGSHLLQSQIDEDRMFWSNCIQSSCSDQTNLNSQKCIAISYIEESNSKIARARALLLFDYQEARKLIPRLQSNPLLIVDGRMTYWQRNQIKTLGLKYDLKVHDVLNEGAIRFRSKAG